MYLSSLEALMDLSGTSELQILIMDRQTNSIFYVYVHDITMLFAGQMAVFSSFETEDLQIEE